MTSSWQTIVGGIPQGSIKIIPKSNLTCNIYHNIIFLIVQNKKNRNLNLKRQFLSEDLWYVFLKLFLIKLIVRALLSLKHSAAPCLFKLIKHSCLFKSMKSVYRFYVDLECLFERQIFALDSSGSPCCFVAHVGRDRRMPGVG